MMAEPKPTRVQLGGIDLDLCSFVWPFYRGGQVERIRIDQGGDRFSEFAPLPRVTDLAIECQGANEGETDSIVINQVRVVEVTRVNAHRMYIILADAREDLHQWMMNLDFNIGFGGGYLDRTRAQKLEDAVMKLRADRPELNALFSSQPFARTGGLNMPEFGQPLSGGGLVSGIAAVLAEAGADLAVTYKAKGASGVMRVVDRQDISARRLPTLNDYDWAWGSEPSWDYEKRIRKGRGKRVRVHYWERHTLRMTINDPSATAVPSSTRVELQQVYAYGGRFLTLPELLEAFGYARTALSDVSIAANILSGRWENSSLPFTPVNVRRRRDVIAVISRDWRTLWRIIYPGAPFGLGGWTDFAFGIQNADGSLRGAAVRVPWVEYKTAYDPDPRTRSVRYQISFNHALNEVDADGNRVEAPFSVRWEQQEAGVLRIQQGDAPPNSKVFLGEFENDLFVDWASSAPQPQGGQPDPPPPNITGIEAQTLESARFKADFALELFMVATRRMPNDQSRFWQEDVPGFPDGDVDYVELEADGRLYAVRDYVDPNDPGGHPDLGDGFGSVLNTLVLDSDSRRRAELYKAEIGRENDGQGEAIGLKLARDWDVEGPVERMEIVVNDLYVGTRMHVGNLAPQRQRDSAASRAGNARGRRAAGKEVV